MKYLIDTNIIIDYLKGIPQTVSFLQKTNLSGFAVSVISVGEILEGLVGQPREELRRRELEDFLAAQRIIDIDKEAAEIFAKIRADLRSKGKLIDNFDILIAATALKHSLTLMTKDKDFERIEDLQLKFIL